MMVKLTFGERLKDALEDAKMEQQELAALVKKNPSTVSKWVSGKNIPPRHTCDLIADALGLDRAEVRRWAGHRPDDVIITPPGIASGERFGTPSIDTSGPVRTDPRSPIYQRWMAFGLVHSEEELEELMRRADEDIARTDEE